MLIYENEGFLEVESKNIKQLCRSTASVPFGDAEGEIYAVRAALCLFLDNGEQRCRVVFYSKTLKRALIFAVQGPENQSSWQYGQEVIAQLGFQLEDVDLKLSPAMLEVVLRDVPGLLSPDEALRERTKKSLVLAELQQSYDKAPDSAQGKKAALKLRAEMRLKGCAEELRLLLERTFSANEAVRADIEVEALASQVKDLTSRLEIAGDLVEAERKQREMSESITAAAEKRIQELEELLVDIETKSSEAIKLNRKIVQLQGRIKKLDEALTSAEVALGKEREKREHSIAEANAALGRITLLDDQLKESETSLGRLQAQLAEEQVERSQLNESLKEAELCIKVLNEGLENAEKQAVQHVEAVRATEDAQAQLVAAQQALGNALDLNSALEETLAVVSEKNQGLEICLQESEKLLCDKTRCEQQVITLAEQNEQLTSELKGLRDECDRERSMRKHLEASVAEEAQRVRELEDSLAKVADNAVNLLEGEKKSAVMIGEVESLRLQLQEQGERLVVEQQSREELEAELLEAQELIASLGEMVRETEVITTEQLARDASVESENQKMRELESKLKVLESQLLQERDKQERLTRAVAVAEQKITEQEEKLAQGQAKQLGREVRDSVVAETVVQGQGKSAKPLPHELRPEPKKGAFFSPDWDLTGLPCRSSQQVFKAWETVFNVQTSLEGYPSQYCMAFLVVLRLNKQKQVYLLYRLKKTKHTLVCVPANAPKDESSLENAVREGLDFLKMSGFAMEAMSTEHIDSTLGAYFMEA